jgi:hypothetical protein
MMARSQPVRASKLREMSSERDCVSTWTIFVVKAGIYVVYRR